MIKDIAYGGYSTTPSDYACGDGELARAEGIQTNEGGEIVPAPAPVAYTTEDGKAMTLAEDETFAFVHQNRGYEHFIIYTSTEETRETHDCLTCGQTSAATVTTCPNCGGTTWSEAERYKVGAIHIYYRNKKDGTNIIIGELPLDVTLSQITAVGNTLVVLTSEGMHYFLWKDTAYVDLGTHLPEPHISFSLKSEAQYYAPGTGHKIAFSEKLGSGTLQTDTQIRTLTEGVKAVLADWEYRWRTHDDGDGKGARFLYPFFVRYAYRLYDGTLTMHSAPVLMLAGTNSAPFIAWVNHSENQQDAEYYVEGVVHQLCYRMDALDTNWKDIIDGISIYVSPQLYPYDTKRQITTIVPRDPTVVVSDVLSADNTKLTSATKEPRRNMVTPDGKSEAYYNYESLYIGGVATDTSGQEAMSIRYRTVKFPYNYEVNGLTGDAAKRHCLDVVHRQPVGETGQLKCDYCMPAYFQLPEVDVQKQMAETSNFYLLEDLDFGDVCGGTGGAFKVLRLPFDRLQNLEARPAMTDDAISHDTIIPRMAFAYNSRLNIADIQRRLFNGYSSDDMLQATHASYDRNNQMRIAVYMHVSKNGEDYVVKADDAVYGFYNGRNDYATGVIEVKQPDGTIKEYNAYYTPFYLYYTDPNAYRAEVFVTDGGKLRYLRVQMKRHEYLDGAYWAAKDWNDMTELFTSQTAPTVSAKPWYSLPTSIYTTEAANPFLITASGFNTSGAEPIIALSAACKPLSEGQYGRFPLYLFTEGGIRALELMSDGTYSDRQVATRDVCNNPASITQTDHSVLFTSARGIMLLQGLSTICLSDGIDETVFDVSKLPGMNKVREELAKEDKKIVPLREYLEGVHMAYDYTHSRIVVFNRGYSYAYMYNMTSKRWTMLAGRYEAAPNSWPDALITVVGDDGSRTVANLADTANDNNTEVVTSGTLVTRPLKLGGAFLKTIRTIIQRGVFKEKHVQTILYGSRDIQNWVLIGSSKTHVLRGLAGTPYRYFRIVLLMELEGGECVTGCTIEYYPKETDRTR